MPYSIRKLKNGRWAIFRRDIGKRAVEKEYNSKRAAERVARLREYHAGEKPSV